MTYRALTESVVEDAALPWLERVSWSVRHGTEIAPGELLVLDFARLIGSTF